MPGRIHSQRPCTPGTTTSGGPVPASWMFTSVPQRLARLQGVLHPFLGLPLADQTHEGFAFEVEQMLFADSGRMRHVATSHDRRQLASDECVVIADAPGPPREMDAQLQGREDRIAADGDR